MTQPIILEKLFLKINEKASSDRPSETVDIERNMSVENHPLDKAGLFLSQDHNTEEHDVLLYTQNLGAKVHGYVEYRVEGKPQKKRLLISEFELDLPKGQQLVRNTTFTKFWETIEEIQEKQRTMETNYTAKEL